MSVEHVELVNRADIRPPSHKLVAVVLAEMTNRVTGICWPSIATIALRTGLSERWVQRILRQLERDGILCVTANRAGGRAPGKGTGRTPSYALNCRALHALEARPGRIKGGVQATLDKGGVQATLEQIKGGVQDHQGWRTAAIKGGVQATQTGINRKEQERAHARAGAGDETTVAVEETEQPNSRQQEENPSVTQQRENLRRMADELRARNSRAQSGGDRHGA